MNDEGDFIDFNIPKLKKFLKQQTNWTFHQEIKQILKEYFQDFPALQNLCKEFTGLNLFNVICMQQKFYFRFKNQLPKRVYKTKKKSNLS